MTMAERVIRAAKPIFRLIEDNPVVRRFRRKHQAYAALFLGPDNRRHGNAAVVWNDLKRFCGDEREGLMISPKSGMADPYASAFLAGKQAVFKRLSRYTYLNLDSESEDAGTSTSDDTT